MNRAKATLTSLRLLNSLLSTRTPATRPLATQVTRFSHSIANQFFYNSHFLSTHQKLFFSSKPDSVVELVLANDWSGELERELEKSNAALTHETVVYILKKLYKDPEKASDFFNWVSEKSGFRPSSSVYSIMLRIAVHKESMKQFWITLRKMKEQGFYVDEETYLSILGQLKKAKMASDVAALSHFYNRMLEENAMDNVVKKVVNIVLETEWSVEVENQLGELKIVLSDNFVLRGLKELRNHPSKALNFFHWVGRCNGYEHNTVTYNGIARVVGRDDSIEIFWSVVEEMKSAGHEMDIDTYIKISRQFQKNKMMVDAVKLYEFMMDSPFKPSVQDCGMLLRSISACENPDLDLVFRVAKKYESTGNTRSKAVYDGIHRSLTSAGRFDEAENVMKAMRNAGYQPDNITYSQVVFGLCKARRLQEACKVLDEMEAQGCLPDIKTWTILIQGHCAADDVDNALMCFAKMMEKDCDFDADLLDVLVNGFLSQNRIDGAYKFLVEMVNKVHVRPWQATHKNLIEKLLSVRKLEEALNLLHLMKKQDHPPFPEPFVQYISKFGTVEDAAEFLKALSVKEYPSSTAYLHVFKAFFQEGRHSEAKDLLFKCPHHIRKHGEIGKLFGSAGNSNATS
ncbi:pentatricopeptide repeat-containing protein At3g48250, chloroplastic [Alnus glutinosa]|uniref:pentatricopeptide repeat-containing protein At3g48250, chloroplastic n=1 Tax=Alnus glutinosa TaxID=3517 RepID=UPI002D79550B|nr:pentatricopeptide repeat-containing protein At3g48250, chloroplastic [Alnus glutinosa]